MAKMQVAVCDVPGCGSKGARAYEVKCDEGGMKADLCDEHAEPIVRLRETLPRSLWTRPGERKKALRIMVDPNAV